MSELYENLPEVGDLDKPKMVFFFDEAHLLFNEAPAFLLEKIDQIVRLIRSKGVGVYFISQNPSDIPDTILAQLQNRIQHALRAYTPAEQKKLKAAAESFRVNPEFDTETVLSELAVGEALVSLLDEKGTPGIVERAYILPPQSFIGAAGFEKIQEVSSANPLYEKYRLPVDPESAYEILMAKYEGKESEAAEPAEAKAAAAEEKAAAAEAKQAEKDRAAEIREQREADRQEDRERRIEEKERREQERQEDRERREQERQARAEEKARKEQERAEEKAKAAAERAKKNSPVTKLANSALTGAGRQIGSSLVRGILGGLLKK